jgi:Tol biopolymer transport system component
MTTRFLRLAALSFVLAGVADVPSADAQYFGRNKVQYEKFDWRILKTDHFDLYFYPAESLKVHDAGRQEERWYTRLSDIFRHQFDRKSIVLYADHPDFQQTNVIGDQPTEGTGGVTEGLRTRVVQPFTGVYADDEHVLGHELVHVFQYNIAETAPGQGGLARLGALPLWLVEGMAEYFSLGRNDALTAMWMRDAVMRDKFPTIKQLTTDPRFFPYRYGEALWAYIGGRWGDRAVVDVYRTALRVGWDAALVRALGLNSDSLSKDWAAANKAFYAGQVVGRTHPDSAGRVVVRLKERSEYNVGPTQSPDGKQLAFFTTKTNLFGIDLVIADAQTGRIIRRLAGPQSDSHFDAISFINSSGDWSPDGQRFAFIVYDDGNNEITILRPDNGKVEKTFRPQGLGAIYNVAWTPDARQLVLSGSKGGISDLYLVDVESGAVRQLTNDRYADLQPAVSPDGRTIAFATDRSDATSFERLTFGDLQIATLDIASGQVTVHRGFSRGKHINPQFSPDGRSLFFVSDQDGIADIYRLDLSNGQVSRITRLATGVSGITRISPAISVAQRSGTLTFTVFKDQGYEIVSLDPSRLAGEPVATVTSSGVASAATLPPGDVAGNMTVASYLSDPITGLVSGSEFRTVPYRASFALDALGQPSLGVASGPFGTGVAGGVSALWGDQLGDQAIYSAVQANGTIRDFGGAIYYQNLKRRLNWLAGAEHIPYLSGYQYTDFAFDPNGTPVPGFYTVKQVLQRTFVDQLSLAAQYPFSPTRRIEVGATGTRLAWEQQVDSVILDFGNNLVEAPGRRTSGGPPPLMYAQFQAALVGDNSFGGFTSPIAGTRYRLEAGPIIGNVQFNTALADGRRYFFMRPFTLAFRGLHYGRFGGDADNFDRLSPLYLGEETIMRGYGYGSFTLDECRANSTDASSRCPVFERLLGSRIAVINAELRIPLFGTSSFGLIDFPYLPLEVSPFFDAGLAWMGGQSPELRFAEEANAIPGGCSNQRTQQGFAVPCAQRIPVFSGGVSFRFNVLGYMILETYVAHPFQRPTKNWVVGVQLAPGW